jgi:hypothetical protein
MKFLQQDDIQEHLNQEFKTKVVFIHIPTKRMVRCETKSQANELFRSTYNIQSERKDVRVATRKEKESYFR